MQITAYEFIIFLTSVLTTLSILLIIVIIVFHQKKNKLYEGHSFYEQSKTLRSNVRVSDVESEGQGVSDHIV